MDWLKPKNFTLGYLSREEGQNTKQEEPTASCDIKSHLLCKHVIMGVKTKLLRNKKKKEA